MSDDALRRKLEEARAHVYERTAQSKNPQEDAAWEFVARAAVEKGVVRDYYTGAAANLLGGRAQQLMVLERMRCWEATEDKMLRFNGEWRQYPGRLLEPKSPVDDLFMVWSGLTTDALLTLPSSHERNWRVLLLNLFTQLGEAELGRVFSGMGFEVQPRCIVYSAVNGSGKPHEEVRFLFDKKWYDGEWYYVTNQLQQITAVKLPDLTERLGIEMPKRVWDKWFPDLKPGVQDAKACRRTET